MYDLLFRNATLVDGSGALRFVGDLAVQDDKIAALGPLPDARARREIDAAGRVLCPGFIDVHTHADMVTFRENNGAIFEPQIRQGITTFIGGNCGFGAAPLPDTPHAAFIDGYHEAFTAEYLRPLLQWKTTGEFMEYLDGHGVPSNVGLLVPHGLLRLAAIGPETRHAAGDEIAQMGRWLEEGMEAGAFGMSTGLQYFPGSQSEIGELMDLARIVARYEGRFTSHLRSYSATLREAVNEVVTIGREADVGVQISHLFWVPDFGPALNKVFQGVVKAASAVYEHVKFPVPSDSVATAVLADIARMREQGVNVAVDAMPTSAGFTHLLAFFPPWVLASKTREDIIAKLSDKATRKRMLRDIKRGDTFDWPHDKDTNWSMNFFKIMGWDSVSIMSVPSEKNRHLEGMTLREIGKLRKVHPFDAACDLLLEEDGKVLVFETLTRPGDDFIETSLAGPMIDPNTSIVTDSIIMGFGLPSHLFYDCFPKYLQRYVRDTGAMTLEQGVRKCTGLPADSLDVKGRGYLKKGYFADLVLFDPETIKTNSTAHQPQAFPDGIDMVVINGQIVVDGDHYQTNARAGRVLRH